MVSRYFGKEICYEDCRKLGDFIVNVMDMAKKSNTQLICLTGLGGESIYNRFDNIYVLNLIAASLRGGTQYLKAEHKRGKEPDELVTERIEVGDQMELLF